MSLAEVVRFVAAHPINRRRFGRGLPDLVAWQLRSRIFPGPHVYPWIGDTRFFARQAETGLTGNIYTGLHEFEDMAFTLHVLRPESLFVDVGANAGSYTLLAAGVAGCGTLAIEPAAGAFERLKQNLALNGLESLVQAVNVAVGETPGSIAFTAHADTMNHALAAGETAAAAVQVGVRRLDDLLAGRVPDVIKIDVEGFELPVLKGATACLRQANCAIVELNGSGERYGWTDAMVAAMLFDAGFKTYRYLPFERRLVPMLRTLSARGNTLFIRDEERAARLVAQSRSWQVKGVDL